MRKNNKYEKYMLSISVFTLLLSGFSKFIQESITLSFFSALISCVLAILLLKSRYKNGAIIGIIISVFFLIFCVYEEIPTLISPRETEQDNIVEELEKDRDKEIYNLAIEYTKQAKYKQAVEQFHKLSESYVSDEKQEEINSVENKFKEEEISKVNSLMRKKRYSEALLVLQDIGNILSNDVEIQLKIEEIQEKQVEEEANNYIVKEQYVEAIDYLNGKIDEGIQNESINELFVRAKGYYVEEIIIQANEFILAKNYFEAENILNIAIQKLGEDTRLSDKLGEVQNKKPVVLANIESRKYDTFLDLDRIANYQDVFGNQYEGISFAGEKWKLMDPFYFGNSYFIAGKFRYLRGTITILNEYKTGKISFYNDGKPLNEYEFDIAQDIPYEIEIDLSGVNLLDIEISGCVLANAKLYVE